VGVAMADGVVRGEGEDMEGGESESVK